MTPKFILIPKLTLIDQNSPNKFDSPKNSPKKFDSPKKSPKKFDSPKIIAKKIAKKSPKFRFLLMWDFRACLVIRQKKIFIWPLPTRFRDTCACDIALVYNFLNAPFGKRKLFSCTTCFAITLHKRIIAMGLLRMKTNSRFENFKIKK